MTYAGVTRGDLYHGNMRFDVNVSVAPKGATELGTRAEVKNLNSFRSVEKAAEYEFRRQVAIIERGEKVVQETRGWDDAKQSTSSQRSKEDAQDYRYMPDADIPPIVLSDEEIAEIQATVPTLPPEYREKWRGLQLDSSVINTILNNAPVAVTLDAINDRYDIEVTKRAFNWFSSTSADEIDITAVDSGLVGPRRLVELSQMVGGNKLSSTGAKEIFLALFDEANTGKMPEDIAREKNLLQVSDEGAIAAIVDEVLADPTSAKAVEDIKNGNDKVIGFLVGQVMKKSQGKANPALAQKLIRERI
jgi:aspartyl-tRNA(Asn)/glutamyl-tRNA(Gln) amidotransferase subunit B